jgi:hypothetical protein
MWKTSWGLSRWETHGNPSTFKTTYVDIKEVLLPSLWEETRLPPPQGFSQKGM